MLDLRESDFHAEPYPYGVAQHVFSDWEYTTLRQSLPPIQAYRHMDGHYEKYSLSEVNHPKAYQAFIERIPLWQEFHFFIKSEHFIRQVMGLLADAKVIVDPGPYRSRWEFSAMPSAGGKIDPHRDIPSKVVTLVIPMVGAGEWDPAWGGGTDLLTTTVPGLKDYMVPLSYFTKVATVPYAPNQALIFVRSEHSWHSVGPIQGPKNGPLRRTLTVNIER